jgi:hypothetical protein
MSARALGATRRVVLSAIVSNWPISSDTAARPNVGVQGKSGSPVGLRQTTQMPHKRHGQLLGRVSFGTGGRVIPTAMELQSLFQIQLSFRLGLSRRTKNQFCDGVGLRN